MKTYINKSFDEERALYGSSGVVLKGCRFDGPADGESALKESSRIEVYDTLCNLRYPFWHDNDLKIENCELTQLCRAALWYSSDIRIISTRLHGIKALRECRDVTMRGCDIDSPEFGWSSKNVAMEDCRAVSQYFMLRASQLSLKNVDFSGKYSFQYVENAVLEDCRLNTKDAFWHSSGVTVKNSVINGEYLAWYSKDLTLINCKISGTQPFCYCQGLTLIDCEMTDCDLAFEKSDVNAVITTPVTSIKNPYSGTISVPSAGELIIDDPAAKARINITGGK